MKITKELFKDITGIQEGPVKITDAAYAIKIGRDTEGKGKAKHPFTVLELEMVSIDENGDQVGEPDHKRYPVAFAHDKRPDLDWVPSSDDENPAVNADGEVGPATNPQDRDTEARGPFVIPTRPNANLGPFGFRKLYENLESLGIEFPNDVRELIGATGEITTEEEEDSKGKKDEKGEVVKYRTQLFLKFTMPNKGGAKATPKAAAKATAKPAAAKKEEEAPAEEPGDAADNAMNIIRDVLAPYAGGKTVKLSQVQAKTKLVLAKYKGADKDDVKALLDDTDTYETFAETLGYSIDGKEITVA